MNDPYAKAGVDTAAADVWVESIKDGENGPKELSDRLRAGVGSYAAVFEQTKDQWLALSCDGVGSKLLWTIEGAGEPEDLAQDLVAMNVNDLLCVGARPQLFMDYLAVASKEMLQKGGLLDRFMGGLRRVMQDQSMLLVGGETAQLPEIYKQGHFDLAGFVTGTVGPDDYLAPDRLSSGQALWAWPSSGPHSNGFSLLRKLFSSLNDRSFVRDHLMAPTRIYTKDFFGLREELKAAKCSAALRGAFHITGSGFDNFLRYTDRSFGVRLDAKSFWQDLPWIESLRLHGLSDKELLKTFNCGWGFVLVVDEKSLSDRIDLADFGVVRIGETTGTSEVLIS